MESARFAIILTLALLGFLATPVLSDSDIYGDNDCEVVINEINTMGRGTKAKIPTTKAPKKYVSGPVFIETEEYIELKSFCKNHLLNGYKLLGISAGKLLLIYNLQIQKKVTSFAASSIHVLDQFNSSNRISRSKQVILCVPSVDLDTTIQYLFNAITASCKQLSSVTCGGLASLQFTCVAE